MDGFRPAGIQRDLLYKRFVIFPVGMSLHIFHYNALTGKGGGATRGYTDTDFELVHFLVKKIRQAGCSTNVQIFTLAIKQHDAAQHSRIGLLYAVHDIFQYGTQWCAIGE